MQQSKEPSNPQSLLNERRAPAVQHSLPAGPSLSPLSYNVWREQGGRPLFGWHSLQGAAYKSRKEVEQLRCHQSTRGNSHGVPLVPRDCDGSPACCSVQKGSPHRDRPTA